MKKILWIQLLFLLAIGMPQIIRADTLTYPFDEISIIKATKFEILINEPLNEQSFLFGQVEQGDTLTVYIGELQFINQGEISSGSPSIMILTTSLNVDLLRWLINSGGSDLVSYETRSFASWILIDPTVGVVKDFSVTQMEVSIYHDLVNDTYSFIDNQQQSFQMVENSLVIEDNLSIIISAYVEAV